MNGPGVGAGPAVSTVEAGALPPDALLVAHGLRLKGLAEPGPLGVAVDRSPEEVDALLRLLAGHGLVARRDGRAGGWSLTPAGRAVHAEWVGTDLDARGARPAVRAVYEGFCAVNPEMLAVCTAWQVRPGPDGPRPNDHRDPLYDRDVVARLVAVHDRVRPLVADLRAALPRTAVYGVRLRGALERVVAGRVEWFTRPMLDSYHTVWFELHEDLLVTLGLSRAEEHAATAR